MICPVYKFLDVCPEDGNDLQAELYLLYIKYICTKLHLNDTVYSMVWKLLLLAADLDNRSLK